MAKIIDILNEQFNEKKMINNKISYIFYNIYNSENPKEKESGSFTVDTRQSNLNFYYILNMIQKNILTKNNQNVVEENEIDSQNDIDSLHQENKDGETGNIENSDTNNKQANNIENDKAVSMLKKISSSSSKLKNSDNFLISISSKNDLNKSNNNSDISGKVGIWIKTDNNKLSSIPIRLGKLEQESDFTSGSIIKFNNYINEYFGF